MKISITERGLKVGQPLQEHVKDSTESSIKRYFENAISADVAFSKETHMFVCDIVANDGTGNQIYYKSQGKEENIFAAFDHALERLEKQLRRYKRRIKNHHKVSVGQATYEATKYVIADDGQDIEDDSEPLIIAEKPVTIEHLTVADAVMRMNLANLPALIFINKKTNQFNAVYKREDGNISWVEAKEAVAVVSSASSKKSAAA